MLAGYKEIMRVVRYSGLVERTNDRMVTRNEERRHLTGAGIVTVCSDPVEREPVNKHPDLYSFLISCVPH